ncbi:hypothetical protein [Evansella cellulosilytica]|uniref:Uncharacterized protein n=1 Tax=Evansella cellulosilytica (strain ATCC 21833 / DSM 2522 / FERM P-1141 / JCM 9156 / N-4) TaxID=649639 RepID=E6U1Z6_EVAC2|nr:hypothetical protein [Evansella cellulosilytica]ADU29240.1 hypothetical protein Bcell_0967 [Evansella cellulosilytica DSM 2522]
MNNQLHIFMEYRIKSEYVKEFENKMPDVMKELERHEAIETEWFEAADQKNLYVEMFKLPTHSHYHDIKNVRRDKAHPIFGQFDQYVEGGIEKVHCWAFVKRS